MVRLKCQNKSCEHEWDYTGEQVKYTNCPKCMFKVHVEKRRVENV